MKKLFYQIRVNGHSYLYLFNDKRTAEQAIQKACQHAGNPEIPINWRDVEYMSKCIRKHMPQLQSS